MDNDVVKHQTISLDVAGAGYLFRVNNHFRIKKSFEQSEFKKL